VRVILLLLFSIYLNALSLNDYTFYKANKLYKEGKYEKALEEYFKIEPKDDNVYFNIANSLYRLKRYQKAIEYYKLVKEPTLNAKRLYNIGNAYVMQKNYLKAIIFYKNALKFSNNPKYRKNLEYAKSQMIALRDVMLSNAKCSATLAELDNFDDQNVSKDLKEAKYKNVPKFNVIEDIDSKVKDFVTNDKNSSDKNRSKILKNQNLDIQRVQNRLKERKNRVLLIPIE